MNERGFDIRSRRLPATAKKAVIKIGKEGSMWRVYDAGSDRTLGKHKTYEEAREQQKAIYYEQGKTEAARNWEKPITEERAREILKEYYKDNAEWVLTDEGYADLIGEGNDKYRTPAEVRYAVMVLRRKQQKAAAAKKPAGPDSVYKDYGYNTKTFERIAKEFAAFVKSRAIKNPGRRDFFIWMDHNHPDITPTAELREMVSAAIWGKDPETVATDGNDKGRGVEKEQEMVAEGAARRRGPVDIGDGFYVHHAGYDSNGNWSVWVSKGANRAHKIQTNQNAPTAHDHTRSEGIENLPDKAKEELKDYFRKFISKSDAGKTAAMRAKADDNDKALIGELVSALEFAAEFVRIARDYFPKSVRNSDRYRLENTAATIRSALHKAKQGQGTTAMRARADTADGDEKPATDAVGEEALPIDDAVGEEILNYIEATPDINDEMFHDFIEAMGVDVSEAESFVYQAFRNMLVDGEEEGKVIDNESGREAVVMDEFASIARKLSPRAGAPKLPQEKAQEIRAEMTDARMKWKDPAVRKEYGGDMVRYIREKAIQLSAALGIALPAIMAFISMQARLGRPTVAQKSAGSPFPEAMGAKAGMGRHETTKSPKDPTYSKEWSGVSNAPHSKFKCPDCGEQLHKEGGSFYCPRCDDYKRPQK